MKKILWEGGWRRRWMVAVGICMESPDAKTNEAPCYTNTRLMLPVQIHNCKLFGSDFETWYMFCARHRGHEIVHGDMIMYVREPVKKRSFYGQADRKGWPPLLRSAPSALTVSKCENFGPIFPIIKW